MEKKRIGILTFHTADNLGAVLQAYALQSAIGKMNDTAEIIDYRCKIIEEAKKAKLSRNPKSWVKEVPLHAYRAIKARSFSSFRRKYLKCSTEQYTPESIGKVEQRYDTVIAGSDQIWNLECSGYDETYFLNFLKDRHKCYSYAASIGSYDFSDSEIPRITEYLSRFEGISVRERDAEEKLMKLGVCARVHPDPVFLLTRQQWVDLMPPRILSQPYVLVYMIGQDQNILDKARKYAREHGFKVISNKHNLEFMLHNSPDKFLSWVYHAECVFTNSFHGCAFSCIFNKPLAAEARSADGKVNNRIWNLLSQINARGCLSDQDNLSPATPESEAELQLLRSEGLEYLRKVCVQ